MDTEVKHNQTGLRLLILIAGGFFGVSAILPWWHVINTHEPAEVMIVRVLALVLAIVSLSTVVQPARLAGRAALVGLAGVLLPFLFLLCLALLDGPSISAAVNQTNEATRLIGFISRANINPFISWTEHRSLYAYGQMRNDYTVIDALETASYFAKPGFYAAFLGGFLLYITAWLADGAVIRRALSKSGPWLGAFALALAVALFGPLAISHYYWNRARACTVSTDYAGALTAYKQAARWDRRLDYDVVYHYQLGLLYAHLNMTHDPDYWAAQADQYMRSQMVASSYGIYRRNVLDPTANPTLGARYATAFLKMGVTDYMNGLPAAAVAKWASAIQADPNNVEVMYALAMGYTKVRNYGAAEVYWRRLIEANESVGLFRYKFAVSFAYRKVITAAAWNNIGWCYYQQGNLQMAQISNANSIRQGSTQNADSGTL